MEAVKVSNWDIFIFINSFFKQRKVGNQSHFVFLLAAPAKVPAYEVSNEVATNVLNEVSD